MDIGVSDLGTRSRFYSQHFCPKFYNQHLPMTGGWQEPYTSHMPIMQALRGGWLELRRIHRRTCQNSSCWSMLFPEFEYAVVDSAAAIVRIKRNGVRITTSHMKMEHSWVFASWWQGNCAVYCPVHLSIWCRSEDEEDRLFKLWRKEAIYTWGRCR